MRDGRSAPPPPPDEIEDELITRAINNLLHTSYTVEELQEKPRLWIDKCLLLAQALAR